MSSVKSTSAEAKAKGGGRRPDSGKAEPRRETRAGKGAGAEEKGSVYREVETSGGRRAMAIFEVGEVYIHIPTELSAAGFELKRAGTVMVTDRVSQVDVCMCAHACMARHEFVYSYCIDKRCGASRNGISDLCACVWRSARGHMPIPSDTVLHQSRHPLWICSLGHMMQPASQAGPQQWCERHMTAWCDRCHDIRV